MIVNLYYYGCKSLPCLLFNKTESKKWNRSLRIRNSEVAISSFHIWKSTHHNKVCGFVPQNSDAQLNTVGID